MSYTPWDIQAGRNIANISKKGALVALLMIGGCIGCLDSCLNKESTKSKTNTPKPEIIAEFIDRNQNTLYEGYRIFKQDGNKKEYLASQPYFSSNEVRAIYFESPFGGTIKGEFDKEFLTSVFNHFKYPNVDKIDFLK